MEMTKKKERRKNGIKIGKKTVIRKYSLLWWVIKLLPVAFIISILMLDWILFKEPMLR